MMKIFMILLCVFLLRSPCACGGDEWCLDSGDTGNRNYLFVNIIDLRSINVDSWSCSIYIGKIKIDFS
jgi:hypothetical protein